jgi:hypothetical protein
MSKYARLGDYLRAQKTDRAALSFGDVAGIIGDTLPASAFKYAQWWENDTHGRHVHANQWLDAGWKTESVSLIEQRVTFVRG